MHVQSRRETKIARSTLQFLFNGIAKEILQRLVDGPSKTCTVGPSDGSRICWGEGGREGGGGVGCGGARIGLTLTLIVPM